MLNGDVLTDIDLTRQLEQHERSGARATLALHPVEDTAGYGVVPHATPTARSRVPREDRRGRPPDEINAGAYVLERAWSSDPAGRAVSFEREVFPALVGDGLYGYAADGLLDRHRDARALPRGHLGPARGPRRAPTLAAARRPGSLVDERRRAEVADERRVRRRRARSCSARALPGRRRRVPRCRESVLLEGCVGRRRAPRVERASILARRRRGRPARRSTTPWSSARRVAGASLSETVAGSSRRRAMLDDVLAQPDQLGDALWRVESAGIRPPTGRRLVVCGMGGSAIGGDLAAAALGDRATPADRRPSAATRSEPGRRRSARSCAPATRATPRRRSPASRPPARPAPGGRRSPPAARWPSWRARGGRAR